MKTVRRFEVVHVSYGMDKAIRLYQVYERQPNGTLERVANHPNDPVERELAQERADTLEDEFIRTSDHP